MDVIKKIAEIKLLPVIKLDSADHAILLAHALCEGGLPAAEVTFRTEAAEASIAAIVKDDPDMLVGAGSLISVNQAKRALDAGAQFYVTAGFNRTVTEFAIVNNVPIFPGVCTPTELMLLLEYNLTIAKFFPASQFGGLATIKALSAPFPQMRFMPTGGVNEKNIRVYLSFEKVIACGGSWMVKDALIKNGDFTEVTRLTREAVKLTRGEEQ